MLLGASLPALLLPTVAAEEAADAPAAPAAGEEDAGEEDETKSLLKQLTISMVADVVDERTFAIRDTAKNARKLIRLGNTAAPERGDLDEAEHAKKIEAGKAFLAKLLEKQMIWYKAAPEEHQPPSSEEGEDQVVLADVWLIDGRHINSLAKKEGHLFQAEHYQEELARDILTAESEASKKQSYKELEEALKESEKAKAKERAEKEKQARAAKKAEEEKGEPLGFAGWMGIVVLLIIVVGAVTNFGRESKKKVNLNRKRGFFGRLWLKLKGA